jgi:hypothetical protein
MNAPPGNTTMPSPFDTDEGAAALWAAFCQRLQQAGDLIMHRPTAPKTPLDRAEGLRYLTRLLRLGLEINLEHADPDFPVFYSASHATAKIGADNPDAIYMNATISGQNSYRITGTRGTIAYFSIGSKANRYHIDGTMVSTGELRGPDLQVDAQGGFEIIASAEPQPGNWLKLEADSSMIIVRQFHLDREAETPGIFHIARIGGPARPPPLSPDFTAAALMKSANFVYGTADTFMRWSELFMAHPNAMPDLDQAFYTKGGGDPRIHYIHGYWNLAPGQALVVDTDVVDCPYWNFQLDNWWMESLDYRHHPVTINKHTARRNANGTLTLVISPRDLGYGNWMDTNGHAAGTSLLRWVDTPRPPVPTTRIVRF